MPDARLQSLWKRRALLGGTAALLVASLWTYHAFGDRQAYRQRTFEARLAQLQRGLADPDGDAEILWQRYHDLRRDFADVDLPESAFSLRDDLKARRDRVLGMKAQRALDDLAVTEQKSTDLKALFLQADQAVRLYADTPLESELRKRRAAYAQRLEERAIEPARRLGLSSPLDFAGRRQLYQQYLDNHPAGLFAEEATAAQKQIAGQWDIHDFRLIRDQYYEAPGHVGVLMPLCKTYRARHPQGKYMAAVVELMRWIEQVSSPCEYKVTLRSGSFAKTYANYVSRGPDMSVELEVGGVRYGPSNIVANNYEPEWNYEFPRRIRWQLGDPVKIRLTDHDYRDRLVADLKTDEGELLAMQLLSGEVTWGQNRLVFESDFRLPSLPRIE